jgi:hypothetical protein
MTADGTNALRTFERKIYGFVEEGERWRMR